MTCARSQETKLSQRGTLFLGQVENFSSYSRIRKICLVFIVSQNLALLNIRSESAFVISAFFILTANIVNFRTKKMKMKSVGKIQSHFLEELTEIGVHLNYIRYIVDSLRGII